MNVLIIGYGSIGERHALIFKQLGCHVGIVSKRANVLELPAFKTFTLLDQALQVLDWDVVVISNKTSEHYPTILQLKKAVHSGITLVEKPLADKPITLPGSITHRLFVAYNLRFHPLLQKLRHILIGKKLLSVQMYVGQYLPTWRDGRDYTQNYSVSKEEGGGVLRDLSHELDLMQWLFGKWQSLTAVGGKYSHLKGDSDDLFTVLVETDRCPMISLHMNYVDRITQRTIVVNTDDSTINVDLINGTFQVNRDEIIHIKPNRDETYIQQARAILNSDFSIICNYDEGMEIITMIEAVEKAAKERKWIYARDLFNMCERRVQRR